MQFARKSMIWIAVLTVLLLLVTPNLLLLIYEAAPFTVARAGEVLGMSLVLWLALLVVAGAQYFFLISLPFLWIVPFEAVYISLYGRPSDMHIFGILSDTTFDEAYQFIKPYLFSIALYLVITSVAVVFFSSQAQKKKVKIPRAIMLPVLIGGSVLGAGIGLSHYSLAQYEEDLERELLFNVNHGAAQLAIVDTFPFGLVVRFSNYQKQVGQMEHLKKTIESFHFGASSNGYPDKEIYVLVIGETTRAKNLSLNGYSRQTTPHLAKRTNLVSFSNMISGWLWTRMSVPVILTRKPVNDKNVFFSEKSIVSLFSEAGYKTFWFSMQSPYGLHDSPIALHAREAEHVKFLNPVDYKGSGFHDDVLLPYLKQAVLSEGKTFIVLHLMGSHFNYSDRYPDQFDIFKPSITHNNIALQNRQEKERLTNSYDNSILFSDHVLDQVIKVVDEQKTVSAVFYVSDHGEVIFDGDCDKSGHGHNTEYDHLTASLLWLSNSYIKNNPDKHKNAFSRKEAPLSTSNIFYSMAGMAGISYLSMDSSKDIFSNKWVPHPRILQNGLNFDTSGRGGVCKEIIPQN